jgi:hypothetical protein
MHFGANVIDPDGDEMTYEWDFGDGTKSYEANPTHTYENPGEYDVTLTCTDCNGVATTWSKSVQVTKPSDDGESPGFGSLVAMSAMMVALLGAAMVRRRH